jgi:hypothetical protein
MLKTSVAIIVALLIAGSAAAQTPPSTAALLARITALEAQVAALTQSCAITTPTLATSSAPVRGQSLAEASAAAQVTHAWPATVYTAKADPAAVAAAAATGAPVASPDPIPATGNLAGATSGDALFWKTRMRGLQTQRDTDRTSRIVLQARVASLTRDVETTVGTLERVAVKKSLLDATAELSRVTAAILTDTRAIANLELEAHRAGVPSGWLILE